MKPLREVRRRAGLRQLWAETGSLWSVEQELRLTGQIMSDLEDAFGPRTSSVNVATDVAIDPGWPYAKGDALEPAKRLASDRAAVKYADRKRVEVQRAAAAFVEKRLERERQERDRERYDRRPLAVASTNPLRIVGCAPDLRTFVAMLTASARRRA